MHSLLFALLLAADPSLRRAARYPPRGRRPGFPDGKWASVTVRQKNLETNKDDKDIWLLRSRAEHRASSRGTRGASTRAGRPTASNSSSSARASSGCTSWRVATARDHPTERRRRRRRLLPDGDGSLSPATSTRSAPATMPATKSAREAEKSGSVHGSSITCSRATGPSGRKASAPTCS